MSIQVYENEFQSAACERCGVKIYPASELESHQFRHELRDLYLEGQKKVLKAMFEKMRPDDPITPKMHLYSSHELAKKRSYRNQRYAVQSLGAIKRRYIRNKAVKAL